MTIRDLVGSIIEGGTIEDTLGKNYVESVFKTSYKEFYKTSDNIQLTESEPFVIQMKAYLYQNKNTDIDQFIEIVKNNLAENFKPSKGTLDGNFPLLTSLGDKIIEKLK